MLRDTHTGSQRAPPRLTWAELSVCIDREDKGKRGSKNGGECSQNKKTSTTIDNYSVKNKSEARMVDTI